MTEKTATNTTKKTTKPRDTRTTATARKTAPKAATSADTGTAGGAGQTPAVREALRKARVRVAETNAVKSEPEQHNPSPTRRQPAPTQKNSGKTSAPAARSETPARTGKRIGASAPAARRTGADTAPPADSGGTRAAAGNVAGKVTASPTPGNKPTTANATPDRRPGTGAGRPAPLGRGELRWMVQDRLYVNPDSEYTAAELSHLLGRSSGAIFNALVKLCELDVAIQTAQKPKTFAWATDTRRRAGIRPTRHPIGPVTDAVLAAANQPADNAQPDPTRAAPDDTAPDDQADAGADEA